MPRAPRVLSAALILTRTLTDCFIAAVHFDFHTHFVVECQWINPDILRHECRMNFVYTWMRGVLVAIEYLLRSKSRGNMRKSSSGFKNVIGIANLLRGCITVISVRLGLVLGLDCGNNWGVVTIRVSLSKD